MSLQTGYSSTHKDGDRDVTPTTSIPRFCVKGLPKLLDFGSLSWWQTDKKTETLKQSCKDLFIWKELPTV